MMLLSSDSVQGMVVMFWHTYIGVPMHVRVRNIYVLKYVSTRMLLTARLLPCAKKLLAPKKPGVGAASVDETQCYAGMTEQQLLAIGHHMSQLLSQHSQCLAELESHRPAEAKVLAESALHQADCLPHPARALGPQHIWRVRLFEVLMRSCIDIGDCWHQALSVGQELVAAYDMVYPKVCDLLVQAVQQRVLACRAVGILHDHTCLLA